MSQTRQRFAGECSCKALRYHLRDEPLFVHACHCMQCQKKAGSAFGITTIVLESDVIFDRGEFCSERIEAYRTAVLCKSCSSTIYVTSTNHPATALLQSGTLDDVRDLNIDAHIWVKRKHPWLTLPADAPQFQEAYDRNEVWPRESLERLSKALEEAT